MPNQTGIGDSGSNYQFGDKMIKPAQRFSQFNLSYLNTMTAKQGQLIPVYFTYYYPGDRLSLSIENLIRVVNPPVVPLASRQRVFFHFFKIDYTQMWYYFESMASKGYSGNFEAILPRVTTRLGVDKDGQKIFNPMLARGSLADYLGFNFSDYTYKTGDEDVVVSLPALPFLAYQRIYRDYYLNKNLNIADKVLLPDTPMDLLIQTKNPQNLTLDGSSVAVDEPLNRLALGELRYRNYVDDYFTSALPWPMRGDVPAVSPGTPDGFTAIGVNVNGNLIPVNLRGFHDSSFSYFSTISNVDAQGSPTTMAATGTTLNGQYDFTSLHSVGADGKTVTNYGSWPMVFTNESLSFTQGLLKLLWTNTLISEKLARTDGTYSEFVQTFFGQRPRHASHHQATYLGGTYQPIVFSQVLQVTPGDGQNTSGTLGTIGGQGISSSDGHVGSFVADDFGVAMCIMSIMPDTYYCQGWHKEHLYQTQDDFPLPERALLGMQPVTQAEIFYDPRNTGNSNSTLFGYQNRFDELRYRCNEIHGEIANPNNKSYFPYTQARYFREAPNLNQDFVTSDGNIRNDWLSYPDEVPYMVQIANRVNAIRNYPYHAPPSALMM